MRNYFIAKILIFSILLALPFLGEKTGVDKVVTLNENRFLAKAPEFSFDNLFNFSKGYVQYYNDNFGFRDLLIKANNLFEIDVLKTSPSDKVIIGENGWLFYVPDAHHAEVVNLQPFSENELKRVKDNLETMDKYFNNKGAKFYVLIAPNASTIYSENLPSHIKKVNPNSKLEQITKYLKDTNSQVIFIDPTENLKAQKDRFPLYYKLDLHWNLDGGLIAYQELARAIKKDFPKIEIKKRGDYQVKYQPTVYRKSLENFIGMTGSYLEYEPIFDQIQKKDFKNVSKHCPDIYNKCDELIIEGELGLPKMVMFRDSFATWLIPFLSENFSRVFYVWKLSPVSTEVVLEEKPDVVVLELTEQNIATLIDEIFSYR